MPTAEDPTPDDPVERLGRRLATSLIIAAGIVGVAIYARPAPPRFTAFAAGSQIVRVDTRTGTIIACEGRQTCQLILRRGQHLTRVRRTDALPKPAATPLPAAPAAGK
jgi:hypothetical protein